MLRITDVSQDPRQSLLQIEGRIVADWVAALEFACRDAIAQHGGVTLDFSAVTFIDRRGVRMLKSLAVPELRIVNCPALVGELLRETETE